MLSPGRNTRPSARTGEDPSACVVPGPVHRASHTEDPPHPASANARSTPSTPTVYTTPFATEGDDSGLALPGGPLHTGSQVGSPQPAASNARRTSLLVTRKTDPPATAGEPNTRSARAADVSDARPVCQMGVHTDAPHPAASNAKS